MMLLGITGGIGSGKSTVCELFTELGAQVYNSDLRASEIMNADGASGNAIRRKIVNLLGAESCKNGMIDTRVVASKVFANSYLLGLLNAIVHPYVISDFKEWAIDMTEAAKVVPPARPYLIMESAILFESGLQRLLDRIITVSAPMEIRLKRLVARGMEPQDARERMENQMSDSERERLADFTIHNDGTLADLAFKVQQLDNQLLTL